MLRRVYTPDLRPGDVTLTAPGSRHVRDVLRLEKGTKVEAFDDLGNLAVATIIELEPTVVLHIDEVASSAVDANAIDLVIATAVPKGERADWMVEKLSELGVSKFVPLATARSVVLPEGRNKRDRWIRIATESAKQSRRAGVMRVEELMGVQEVLEARPPESQLFVLSTSADAMPIVEAIQLAPGRQFMMMIGPEGGWTEQEIDQFVAGGAAGLKLTDTVLRVETAAIATAAVIMSLSAAASSNPPEQS